MVVNQWNVGQLSLFFIKVQLLAEFDLLVTMFKTNVISEKLKVVPITMN